MIRSLYTAASSMITTQQRQNVIGNNLVNASTIGYKSEKLIAKTFDDFEVVNYDRYINGKPIRQDLGNINLGLGIDETVTNFEQGNIVPTDSKLDVAIQGQGYFTVEDTQGNRYYTRDGNFRVDSQGYLTTNQGYYVLGQNTGTNNLERISVGNQSVDISPDNRIFLNGQQSYKFNIVNFNEKDLGKVGDNLYSGKNPTNINSTIIQGALENSNVNVIAETNEMMMYSREYEANQKIIQTIDSTLEKIANEIGVVR